MQLPGYCSHELYGIQAISLAMERMLGFCPWSSLTPGELRLATRPITRLVSGMKKIEPVFRVLCCVRRTSTLETSVSEC
jgi:hypothetical protein